MRDFKSGCPDCTSSVRPSAQAGIGSRIAIHFPSLSATASLFWPAKLTRILPPGSAQPQTGAPCHRVEAPRGRRRAGAVAVSPAVHARLHLRGTGRSEPVSDAANGLDERAGGVGFDPLAELGNVLIQRAGLREIVEPPRLVQDRRSLHFSRRETGWEPADQSRGRGGIPRSHPASAS